ncbi:MAG: hypothetical protein KDK39_11720, partial [Leptospiraceae bacterium]|nr:hypothetical protein [Leptospiraceae bacterium]
SKEIILHPGESFEREIDVSQLYDLKPGIAYRIAGYFWPDYRNQQFFIRSSNMLALRLKPRPTSAARPGADYEQYANDATGAVISPAQTVYLFLSAEMRSNWPDYFKFLDLERFIASYDHFAARFAKARQTEKNAILDDFRDYLATRPADRLAHFKIIANDKQTELDPTQSPIHRTKVKVEALRTDRGYNTRYVYTYTLELDRGSEQPIWRIIQVEAHLKSSGGAQ